VDAAIWAVIDDGVKFVAGTLVAVSFFIACLVALLDGLRAEKFSIFRRLEGVIKGLERDKT